MPTRASRVPARRAHLVGRDAVLAEVRDLTVSGVGRLVTLTGAGGSGKTTLAFEAARTLDDEFPDGVVLLDLTDVRHPDAVAVAGCRALGILDPAATPTAALTAYLATRHALLVLDTCEHLLPAVRQLVDALLDGCPDLRILATSRTRLGVRGESVVAVPPLPVPDDGVAPDAMAGVPSVELFVRHASAAAPGFSLDSWAPSVATICRRLDGLPLAIELAAAQSGALTPPEIAARLSSAEATGPGGDGESSGERTVESTLDWSHALLSDREQTLFRRLAVFAGGWTLEAAEAVCATGGDAASVAPTLVSLVDHSLVVREVHEAGSRFRMLAPVAQYARRRLTASDEVDAVSTAHARYLLRLISGGEGDWRVVEPEHLDVISAEYDNISTALRFAEGRGDVALVLGLDQALMVYWRIRGHLRVGVGRLEAAARLVGNEPSRARGLVLTALAHYHQLLGEPAQAWALATEAERVLAECGSVVDQRTVIGFLGDCARDLGDLAGAVAHYRRAKPLLVSDEDRLDLGFWHANIGQVAVRAGDLATAERELGAALGLLHSAPGWYQGHVLVGLGSLARGRGDVERARALLLEALGHLERYRATIEVTSCLDELGRLALDLRDHERAATLLAAATGLRDAVGLRLRDAERAVQAVDVDAVRAALAPEVFDRAWALGLGLTLRDATHFASGAPAAPPAIRERRRGSALTEREREIATLVARGLTNRAIAQQLVIAPGTVRIHVERILGKLGLTSRVQVATWVTRQESGHEPSEGPTRAAPGH